jgi:hypothetical protein
MRSDKVESAEFEVKVPAKLIVRPEYGEEWEATEEDLARFGFKDPLAAYSRFVEAFKRALGVDDLSGQRTPDAVSTMRYLVECALMYDHDFDYAGCDEDAEAAVRMVAELREAFGVAGSA